MKTKTNEKTTLDTLYLVNNTYRRISLEILTGGVGQTSAIQVFIEGILDEKANGKISLSKFANNKELEGKKLVIVCNITDTSRDHNFTEMIVRLEGGRTTDEYPLRKIVENEGETAEYKCVIEFFNPDLL